MKTSGENGVLQLRLARSTDCAPETSGVFKCQNGARSARGSRQPLLTTDRLRRPGDGGENSYVGSIEFISGGNLPQPRRLCLRACTESVRHISRRVVGEASRRLRRTSRVPYNAIVTKRRRKCVNQPLGAGAGAGLRSMYSVELPVRVNDVAFVREIGVTSGLRLVYALLAEGRCC